MDKDNNEREYIAPCENKGWDCATCNWDCPIRDYSRGRPEKEI